jgi:hypothetical protein
MKDIMHNTAQVRTVLIGSVLTVVLLHAIAIMAQESSNTLQRLPHSASMQFMKRDGFCIYGNIEKMENNRLTIRQGGDSTVEVLREDLIQISHGDALVYSARSSWADVQAVHIYPKESFIIKLTNGKIIKGKPISIDSDSLKIRHGFLKRTIARDDIATLDYLRMRPQSDGFDYLAQESPILLFFDPEFYSRIIGLQGKIPIRLYDSKLPNEASLLECHAR